jgi:S1-C subfamily serine protease
MLPQSTATMSHGSLHGAVILAVIPGSPAEAAGVRGGDLIVKLDGKLVESGKEILDLIAKAKPHSVVTVDILRGSAHVVAHIKL